MRRVLFFVNYEIEERGSLYRMVRDVHVFAHPFLYTQTAGIKMCRRGIQNEKGIFWLHI